MKKKELLIVTLALAGIVALGIVLAMFLGKPYKQETTTSTTSAVQTSQSAEGGDTEKVGTTTANMATSGAKVISSDAIETIKALSEKELGLKNKDDYRFMVSNNPYKIDGGKYIEVIAAKVVKNHDGTYKIDTYGKYYISFDGSKIVKQDLKTEKYSTIK